MLKDIVLKTSFWSDKALDNCTISAKYLYIALTALSDGNGCGVYNARAINALLFTYTGSTQKDIVRLVKELCCADKLLIYKVDNGWFYKIKDYSQNKTEPCIYPQPEDGTPEMPAQLAKSKKNTVRHEYGEYKNVLFTDEEYEKLKKEFPNDYKERIESLSVYIASSGKRYKNHLATLRNWKRMEDSKASAAKAPEIRQKSNYQERKYGEDYFDNLYATGDDL